MNPQGSSDGDPPAPEPSAGGSSHGRRRESQSDTTADGPEARPRDPGAMNAEQVRRSCKMVYERLSDDNALNSSWAAPLEAAPTAIFVMKSLLKIAVDKRATNLAVSDPLVKSETGEDVGTLPSKQFCTNLQHCSDVGRLAFMHAQQKMNKINTVTRIMMEDGGMLGFIVELLEDLESAKMNLMPELEEMKCIAVDCRRECESVKKKFECWQQVIIHLSQTALDLRGENVLMKREVSDRRKTISVDVIRKKQLITSAENKVREMKVKLNTAGEITDRAPDELESEEDKLVGARYSFAEASADLERLGNKELELEDMAEILRESTYQLGILKQQVEPLIIFFSALEATISCEVMHQADTFLNTIERNVRNGDNPDDMSIRLGKASKKRVLEAALHIQGRFSVIADISSAYVKISNTCIKEAIGRMEAFSNVDAAKWEDDSKCFDEWCRKAIDEIHRISKEASDNAGDNARTRIDMLGRRAVEAAEEAAEDW